MARKPPEKSGKKRGGNPPVEHRFSSTNQPKNRGRKPSEKTIMGLVIDRLDEPCPSDKKGRTWRQLLGESLMMNAIKGNGTAIRQLMDRVDGVVEEKTLTDVNLRIVYEGRDDGD